MNINTGPRHFITRENVGRQPTDHFVSDLGNHDQQVVILQQAQEILLIGVVTIAPIKYVPENIEAYSWGVGEGESGDGLYCGFEGVVGAAVIGV